MSSNLERRYRTLLRVLPAWYRAEREEEMVGIFFADRGDDLDLEHGWPGWGEAAATLGLAVRVRFGVGRPAGAVVRLLALTGLLGLLVVAAQSWTVSARFGWAGDRPVWWYDVLAVAAFAALVSGRRAAGRVAGGLLGLAALWPVVWTLAEVGAMGWPHVLWQLPVWVTAVAVLLGFHREAPPVPRVWWVMAPVALVVGAASVLFTPGLSTATMLLSWLVAVAVVAAFRPWTARATTPATTGH
ncbi:hypothetical protein F4560_002311 [Saccharothrix ecbatanensis]|uniref:Uncharacterized protein n=1 Tax=Saccharothrix ecbatanensis TaxID=1105145 RepID=A0A7W9M095_9PSEU|nr:hypothetical protein [Saccharothrix ecbatanensis]MBB5802543.1 hypothetical protein [Saccharothrix ecbatanensis]